MEFLARGRRGVVYVDVIRGKKVVIKKKNPVSKAVHALENEAYWTKVVNKKKIGPKFISFKQGKLVREFAPGVYFKDWVKTASKQQQKRVFKNVLKQCFTLDQLKMNKFELHHPTTNILVGKQVVLIDFERCRKSKNPKNVTQFSQFLLGFYKKDKKKFKQLMHAYKASYKKKEFEKILKFFLL